MATDIPANLRARRIIYMWSQRLAHWCVYRCSPRLFKFQLHQRSHRSWSWLMILGGVALCTTTVGGQTLFARPDTTPDYASYRDIEECKNAIFRVAEAAEGRGQTIWWDTVGLAARRARGVSELDNLGRPKVVVDTMARPDAAIQAGRACLARFNADTATVDAPKDAVIFETLLMAHRDDDAHRYAERLLDSMRARSETKYKDKMQFLLQVGLAEYARPVRYAAAKQMYAKIMAAVAGDSLYRTVYADRSLSIAATRSGDTIAANELAWRAIRTSDAMPIEERMQMKYYVKGWLADRIAHLTEAEGFDSLAISTVAYRMYYTNTVLRRVYGGELATATDARVQPYKVPDLIGEHYYTSTAGASSGSSGQALASYTTHGAVPPGTLPVKGRINYITSWPSFCHTERTLRPPEQRTLGGYSIAGCERKYNDIRMAKELYPDLEIIVLSNTYGTVGRLGPLKPADEADTLAKLFLGHGRVPAHLVVEHTPFFHVDAPDGRRIDLPTPQMELLGYPRTVWDARGGVVWLVDKEGYVVKDEFRGFGKGPGSGDRIDRMIKILRNRPSKP